MRLRSAAAAATVVLLSASVVAAGGTSVEGQAVPTARYIFGLLRKGSAWTAQRTARTDSLQAGHMANIGRMWEEGVLVGAGPFLDDGDLRGIFIFRADSAGQVRALAERDPAIRAGRLTLDLHAWQAAAGIGEPYRRLAAAPGHRDSMIRLHVALLRRPPRGTQVAPAEASSLRPSHLEAILRRVAAGELAAGGPCTGHGDLAGVLVLRGDSTAARRLALADPQVRAGRLTVEMHPWLAAYGVLPGDTLR